MERDSPSGKYICTSDIPGTNISLCTNGKRHMETATVYSLAHTNPFAIQVYIVPEEKKQSKNSNESTSIFILKEKGSKKVYKIGLLAEN